ncbi:hypothetical protein [Maribellus maritimus]|uniref:hypothetical protein n=1 Tax=Maribellus maritimus TaxID=2870838 RepID=UPI001EEBAFE4|nr:hypothetical protein [Maribellus maritimus]MCG6188168.1 hypothetical protein [Maribellus maritimus]
MLAIVCAHFIKLAEQTGNINLLATSQNEIAYVYRIKRDLRRSLDYCQKAYSNFIDLGLYEYAINLSGAISIVPHTGKSCKTITGVNDF